MEFFPMDSKITQEVMNAPETHWDYISSKCLLDPSFKETLASI